MANDNEDKKKRIPHWLFCIVSFKFFFILVEGWVFWFILCCLFHLQPNTYDALLCFLDANALATHNKHDIIPQFELCSIFFFQFNPDRVGIFSLQRTKNSIIALLPVAVKKHVGFRNYHGECIHIVNGEALSVWQWSKYSFNNWLLCNVTIFLFGYKIDKGSER